MLDRHRVSLQRFLYAAVREDELLVFAGEVVLIRRVQLFPDNGDISILVVEHLRRDGSLPAKLSRVHLFSLVLRLVDGAALHGKAAGRERTWQQAVLTRRLNLHV